MPCPHYPPGLQRWEQSPGTFLWEQTRHPSREGPVSTIPFRVNSVNSLGQIQGPGGHPHVKYLILLQKGIHSCLQHPRLLLHQHPHPLKDSTNKQLTHSKGLVHAPPTPPAPASRRGVTGKWRLSVWPLRVTKPLQALQPSLLHSTPPSLAAKYQRSSIGSHSRPSARETLSLRPTWMPFKLDLQQGMYTAHLLSGLCPT